jgi:hypothetical protein
MCRNIKPLFNYDPPATDTEVHEAAVQFVRKVSGFTHPSEANEAGFNQAVAEISESVKKLLDHLSTSAHPHNREEEAKKAHLRALKRFGR